MWTVAIVVVVVLLGVGGYMLIKRYAEEIAPKKKVQADNRERSVKAIKRILSGYVRRNDGRVIYSMDVASSKTSGSADAILIGYFGALVLVGCDFEGDLYIDSADVEKMTQIVKKERAQHDNPALAAKTAAKAVNEMLREKKVYRVPVENGVVFTNARATANVPGSVPTYTPKKLKKALRANRFLEDKGVDPDKVAEALLSWR